MKAFIPLAGNALVACLLMLSSQESPGQQPDGPWGGVDGTVSATGTIEGVVRTPDRPARRVAQRYPTHVPEGPREEQAVPAVVHLEGPVQADASEDPAREIVQRDSTFVPPLVVVPVGGTVAFPNDDPFFHNVFSYSRPARFDLGRYHQGESKGVTFQEPGYVKVFCEIHDQMRAAVLVVENPFHAQVDEDGHFTLTGVPPGTHTLKVTDFDHGTRAMDVDVPSGGTVQVEVELEG